MNDTLDIKAVNALDDIENEYLAATEVYGSFASPHEGYAIIKEELDELWDEVKLKPSKRDKQRMYDEAKQIAAMALRFMVDICR